MIIKYWNIAKNFGVADDMKLLEQKRVMLLNEITIFLSLSIVVIYLPIELLTNRDIMNIILILGTAIIILTPMILNHLGKIHIARWFFCLMNILGVVPVIIFFGEGIRVDFVWMLHWSLVMIFFRNNLYRSFLSILVIVGYFLSRHLVAQNGAVFPIETNIYLQLASFAYVMIGIVIIIGRFVSTTTHIEEELRFSFENLKKKQNQLLANKKQIEVHNAELEDTNTELAKFAYVASHDLKTPIRNISSFLSLIKRKLKDHDDENIHEYIEYATNSAYQMNTLIQDILEYSRIEISEKSDLEWIDLDELVSAIEENMETELKEGNVLITRSALPKVRFNPDYLYMLFENLIKNATLYNDSHIPRVDIKGIEKESSIEIRIQDNGIGILQEHQEQIFEMFKRLHTQVKYKGSGIGLAICKKIVEQMNGSITVKSQIGKGSVFIIELPKL